MEVAVSSLVGVPVEGPKVVLELVGPSFQEEQLDQEVHWQMGVPQCLEVAVEGNVIFQG